MSQGISYATGYVDLVLRTNKYDAPLARAKAALGSVAGRSYTINLRVIAPGMAAMISGLKSVKSGLASPVTIPIRANPRPFFRDALAVQAMLRSLQKGGTIDLKLNRLAATASLTLYMQQLRAARALAAGVKLPPAPSWKAGGGARGGAWWSNTTFGGGLAQGAAGALGIPLSGSPQAMGGELIGRGLVRGTTESVKTFAELESQLADIRRVAGLTAGQLADFKASIMALGSTTPGVAVSDLLEIGQVGGRMGVADRGGVAGLTQFTKDLARVRLAVKDVGTEELANSVSRVLNVFQLGTEHVAGFGSALTAMDNVSTASARDILDIGQRLSGTAASIGLTIPQVLALSSVLKDVGLSNEVAGSSFSQIFRKIGSDAGGFAEKIGADATKFADAYRRDPMEALGMMIERFKEMKDTLENQEFLDSLRFKGVRVAATFQQISAKFDEVRRRAALAAEETGTKASLGAAERIAGATTEAQFTRTANALTDLRDATGERLAGPARWAARQLTDVASALASIVRNTNQASFAGKPGAAAAAAAPMPAAKGAAAAGAPKDVFEAAARRDAAAGEAEHLRAGLPVWQMARDAAKQQAADAVRAFATGAGTEAQARAAEAKLAVAEAQFAAATKALGDAMTREAQAEDELEKIRADQAAKDAKAQAAGRLPGLFGRLGGEFEGLGGALAGAGGRLLSGVAGGPLGNIFGSFRSVARAAVSEAEEKRMPRLETGLTGADMGRRLAAAALNTQMQKDQLAAAKETADNTGGVLNAMFEVRDILKDRLGRLAAAVTAP